MKARCEAPVWRGICVLAVIVVNTRASMAVEPNFKLLRYDEDYSYLARAHPDSDVFDPVKFVPLDAAADVWLSLGGEVRERYEYFNHTLWGQGPQDSDGYLLQRVFLHGDLHLGDPFRAFVQLKDSRAYGRAGGPRSIDEDRIDLNQAFIDWKWSLADNVSLTARAGRQELAYGSSRLISPREGTNVHQSFDGLRGILSGSDYSVDAFATDRVENRADEWDDRSSSRGRLWGVYSAVPCRWLPGGHLDAYYLGVTRDAAQYDQGTAREKRHSIGMRIWGEQSGWDYNLEFVYQFGEFGPDRIRAWMVASETGFTLHDAPLRPRLSLKLDAASGDRDPGDSRLESFNALYPRSAYFNDSSLIGASNFVDIHPALDVHPDRLTTVTLDCDLFWRESVHDGLYGLSLNLVRTGLTTNARFIGSQPSIRVERGIGRHWNAAVIYAHFIAGAFLQRSGPGQDLDYVNTTLTLKF